MTFPNRKALHGLEFVPRFTSLFGYNANVPSSRFMEHAVRVAYVRYWRWPFGWFLLQSKRDDMNVPAPQR
jgi:hypothetical protein